MMAIPILPAENPAKLKGPHSIHRSLEHLMVANVTKKHNSEPKLYCKSRGKTSEEVKKNQCHKSGIQILQLLQGSQFAMCKSTRVAAEVCVRHMTHLSSQPTGNAWQATESRPTCMPAARPASTPLGASWQVETFGGPAGKHK